MKKILRYFDRLEDRVRGRLSRYPILYTMIGGTAVVMFWRGVWITADEIALFMPESFRWVDGPISVVASVTVLLVTGLFVSIFVTDRLIMSGLRKEKKLVEKTEGEVRGEVDTLSRVKETIERIEQEIHTINNKIN